jgi:hypothetical protein
VILSTKGIYLYREDTNYTKPLQQRSALMAISMHTTKNKNYIIFVLLTVVLVDENTTFFFLVSLLKTCSVVTRTSHLLIYVTSHLSICARFSSSGHYSYCLGLLVYYPFFVALRLSGVFFIHITIFH